MRCVPTWQMNLQCLGKRIKEKKTLVHKTSVHITERRGDSGQDIGEGGGVHAAFIPESGDPGEGEGKGASVLTLLPE